MRGREDRFKIILQAKYIIEDEKARIICDKYGVEKAEVFKLKYGPIMKCGTLIFLEGGSVVTPKNKKYDMLVNFNLQTHFKIFTINIKQQKQIVIKSEQDFNRKAKASKIIMGISSDFDLDRLCLGIFVLDGLGQAGKPVIC